MRVVVVKLGSAIVTVNADEPRLAVLERVCDHAAEIRASGDAMVIVSSGAIAMGMAVMSRDTRPTAMEELQAASAVGQGTLFAVWQELLRDRGIVAAQVLLTLFDVTARSHYVNARRTLRALLDWGVVPVINENDTTATDEISFGDNDVLAAQVAILLRADELLLLTDTAGVYSSDPREPGARLIEEVDDFEVLRDLEIGASGSALGTGGMRSKVMAAEMATAAGVATVVLDGLAPDGLGRALRGERVGTRFLPRDMRASSFQLWLHHAKPARGVLIVAPHCLRAVLEHVGDVGVSDVRAIDGDFAPGDAVGLRESEDSPVVGKGIVTYSASELRRLCAAPPDAREQLAGTPVTEVVHRDYFTPV